jgi:O-antigen ligase
MLASCISGKKVIKTVFDVLIGAGIFQALIAVLQHIPGLGFPNAYRDLPPLALEGVYLSSGLTDNPIFYGSFMTIVFAVAAAGAVFDGSKKRRTIYFAAASLFFLTGLFTSSIVPIIGLGTGALIFIITAAVFFKNKKTASPDGKAVSAKNKGGAETPAIDYKKRFLILCGVIAAIFALVFIFQGIYIRDKAIAVYDGHFRKFISGAANIEGNLYELAWPLSADIIKENPVLGAGPDCFAVFAMKNGTGNTIDRSYNEYLYTAATRGIPSLIIYLALLAFTVKILISDMKKFFSDGGNWFIPALLTAVISYSVQAFFSASAVTTAPFFWLILGAAQAKKLRAESEKKNAALPRKPAKTF